MKTHLRNLILLLATFVVAGAFAATPSVEVTVRQSASGKVMQKLRTDADGSFALTSLPAGIYSLEFRSERSPSLKNKEFTLSIAGTKQAGTQGGIAGSSLVGGVAINVEMDRNARVFGQIVTGLSPHAAAGLAWEPQQIGTNVPGRWTADTTTAPRLNVVRMSNYDFNKLQEKSWTREP